MTATSDGGAILRFDVDDAERSSNAIDTAKLAATVEALSADGAVILTGAVDPELLDRLSVRMSADLVRLLARPDRPENFAPGHLQQDPPPYPDTLWPAILASPFALQVCRAALRQQVRLSAYTNNTNLPGSVAQPVHVDEGQLWPGLPAAHPPARLIVNIPLSTTDEARGAIELWPGTHLDTRLSRYSATPDEGVSRALQYLRAAKRARVQQEANRRVGLTVPESLVEDRRHERPPVRATTLAGSIVIRDPRLWHRGTPNVTDSPRFMLSLTYDPGWRACEVPIVLPSEAQSLFEAADLDVYATYVDGPVDYLQRHRPPATSPLRPRTAMARRRPDG